MRVLVCGGRNFGDYINLKAVLDSINADRGIDMVIHGGASGADKLASQWVVDTRLSGNDGRLIMRVSFPANWRDHGKSAGPIRNQKMIDQGNPDLVIAFPGGRGTADMVARARKAGIEVMMVDNNDKQT